MKATRLEKLLEMWQLRAHIKAFKLRKEKRKTREMTLGKGMARGLIHGSFSK